MNTPTLEQRLKNDPSLICQVSHRSYNPEPHIEDIRESFEIINKSLIKASTTSEAIEHKDIVNTLSKALRRYSTGATSLIDCITDYQSKYLNPLTRYNFSSYTGETQDLDKHFIGDGTQGFNTFRKLKVFTYLYLNQILSNNPLNEIPLLNNPACFGLMKNKEFKKYDMSIFSKKNATNPTFPKNEVGLKFRFFEIEFTLPLDIAFDIIDVLIDTRNFIGHGTSININHALKDIDSRITDLISRFSQKNIPIVKIVSLLDEGKYLEVISIAEKSNILSAQLYESLYESNGLKKILTTLFSILLSSDLRDSHSRKLSSDESVKILHFVKFFLDFYDMILDSFVSMIEQINPLYSHEDTIIEEYKFSYLTRNLDNIEDCLDINGRLIIDKYVKKIKDKEFKNRKATIFDIVEYSNQKRSESF